MSWCLSIDNAAGFKSRRGEAAFTDILNALRIAEKRKLENILIIEDDIALSSSMARLTPDIIRKTNDFSWDLLYFGHEHTGDIGREQPQKPVKLRSSASMAIYVRRISTPLTSGSFRV